MLNYKKKVTLRIGVWKGRVCRPQHFGRENINRQEPIGQGSYVYSKQRERDTVRELFQATISQNVNQKTLHRRQQTPSLKIISPGPIGVNVKNAF